MTTIDISDKRLTELASNWTLEHPECSQLEARTMAQLLLDARAKIAEQERSIEVWSQMVDNCLTSSAGKDDLLEDLDDYITDGVVDVKRVTELDKRVIALQGGNDADK